MSEIKITKLQNGLHIITDPVKDVQSVALGIWVGTGARHETKKENGITHFIEHMMFKGTQTRNAFDISREIENVGGNMNAYTSRELTSYHIHGLKNDLPLFADILCDMVLNSNFPPEEIERERGVILQEIGMCKDTPDDIIFDNYFETAYSEQSAGAPILGTSGTVRSFSGDDLREYIDKHYLANNTVIVAAGNVKHEKLCDLVSEKFENFANKNTYTPDAANYTGGQNREQRDLEQSHIVLGFEGFGRTSEHFYTAQALSSLMGGGMSSRLFQEIREKRGLVYSIFSFHQTLRETGQFGIYAGTGPESLNELVPVLCDEILKITTSDITEEELNRTKAQLKSSLVMGQESMMNRADRIAKQIIIHGKIKSVKDQIKSIDHITAEDIRDIAVRIFSGKPTLAAVGPLENLESYEKICDRF